MGQACSPVVGVEAFRSISELPSELQCEVGGIAVLPLEKELPSIPLPELLTSDTALLCYLSHILQAYKVHHGWHCPWPHLIFGNAGNEPWYRSDIVFTRPPAQMH